MKNFHNVLFKLYEFKSDPFTVGINQYYLKKYIKVYHILILVSIHGSTN